MRVAALYDIHGNLPALEAVLAEVEAAAPDLVVVGGDVVAGPMPAETLDRLAAVGDRVRWVMGNADRMVVEAYDRGGRPADPEDAIDRLDAWVARQLTQAQRDRLAAFEPLVRTAVDGLGGALLPRLAAQRRGDPHRGQLRRAARRRSSTASPRRSWSAATRTTSSTAAPTGVRLLNAGSVGMPYEDHPRPTGCGSARRPSCAGPTTTSPRRRSGCARPARPTWRS